MTETVTGRTRRTVRPRPVRRPNSSPSVGVPYTALCWLVARLECQLGSSPARYTWGTQIRVASDDPDISGRLQIITDRILNSSRLLHIIDEFNLYDLDAVGRPLLGMAISILLDSPPWRSDTTVLTLPPLVSATKLR
jgi:hypothetical protein